MSTRLTVQQRERELQSMLETPEGRKELETLEARYSAASRKTRAAKTSVITFILIHERQTGQITN